MPAGGEEAEEGDGVAAGGDEGGGGELEADGLEEAALGDGVVQARGPRLLDVLWVAWMVQEGREEVEGSE